VKRAELTYLLLGVGGYLLMRRSHVPTSLDTTQLHWPVRVLAGATTYLPGRGGSRITNEFKPGVHVGVDIAVPAQLTSARADVVAVAAGKVVRAWRHERGWAVLLSHEDWASGYLHLAELDDAIADGKAVAAGQRLGPMGADPMDPERIVHLHLQLAPGGEVVDPTQYLAQAV
jgi:murein DD-endopeptidase MepM/ murein hydrolase activator NlpD